MVPIRRMGFLFQVDRGGGNGATTPSMERVTEKGLVKRGSKRSDIIFKNLRYKLSLSFSLY